MRKTAGPPFGVAFCFCRGQQHGQADYFGVAMSNPAPSKTSSIQLVLICDECEASEQSVPTLRGGDSRLLYAQQAGFQIEAPPDAERDALPIPPTVLCPTCATRARAWADGLRFYGLSAPWPLRAYVHRVRV